MNPVSRPVSRVAGCNTFRDSVCASDIVGRVRCVWAVSASKQRGLEKLSLTNDDIGLGGRLRYKVFVVQRTKDELGVRILVLDGLGLRLVAD